MTTATLDAPKVASRFVQAGSGQAQAEVLREAFDERDRTVQAHEQSLQEQAKALQVLRELVQKLQADTGQTATKADVAAQAQHQAERTDGKFETLRAEIATGFAKADAKVDLLRKDMEAMQNNLIIKLGGIMVLALGAGATIMKMFFP